MKKIILFLLFIFFTFNHSLQAKVLSENYLENVVQVNLKNGQKFIMCLSSSNFDTPLNDDNPTFDQPKTDNKGPENPNFPPFPSEIPTIKYKPLLTPNLSPPPINFQKPEEIECQEKHILILADLEYVYLDGTRSSIDRLFVFDNNLYRPDGIRIEYYPETQNQIYIQDISELHITDPNLPNGQKATGGKMLIVYDKKNPQLYKLYFGGNTAILLAGKINEINLILDGKAYFMQKKIKEINNVTLLNVIRPSLSPTPTISFSVNSKTGFKKYTNIKHGFSLEYPDNLTYEEESIESLNNFSLFFYLKDKKDKEKYEYNIVKNFVGGWGPLYGKEEEVEQVIIEGKSVPIKLTLTCVVPTPGADPEDPINCIKDVNSSNYGSAYLNAYFQKNNDHWYFFGPTWDKGERQINEEVKKFVQILSTLKFEN